MANPIGISLTFKVLRRSPNAAAVEVLLAALRSPDAEVRSSAVRSLAERADVQAQTELLSALATAAPGAREAAREQNIVKRMRRAVIAALKSGDATLTKQACRYAIDAEQFAALPTVVEQAMDPEHPYKLGLATAALRLCQAMATRLEQPVASPAADGADPAFYRTTTLQRLTDAAERFAEHQRLELVEALLLVTTRDNTQLTRLLRTEGHPCHDALTDALAESPSFGALDVLGNTLLDSDTPGRLLELAAKRADKPFLARLADHIGYPIGVRPRENAHRVARFAWMERESRGVVLELTPTQQAVVVSLAAACSAPVGERLRFLQFVLESGADKGRTAACHLLRDIDSLEVPSLLGSALRDPFPGVVAAAARQLRQRKIPGAEVLLIDMLEHTAPEVRRAAQDELHELNLASYRQLFDQLSEPARRAAGRLVARADPDAAEHLAADLRRPVAEHRLEALAVIDAMGLTDQLAEPLADALADTDIGVRAEAARLLGGASAPSEAVVGALVGAAADSNLAVRAAVDKSLDSLRSVEVAAGLIEQLQREFDSDQSGGDA